MANISDRFNEQERNDKFVRLCRGRQRADRLQQIWDNSYPRSTSNIFVKLSKTDVFKETALREGFTEKQINAFLRL